MDIKELKLNHVVQIRKENECPRTCLITNIGDNYVDVEVVNINTVESMPHVDIETIFPIDLLETHVLALGFIKTEQTLYPELLDYSVYLYNKNGKTVT